MKIKDLFHVEGDMGINRRIEKVIQFETSEAQLKSEISEYIVTDHLQDKLSKLLENIDASMSGNDAENAVWISGFYGSGKSSFAKYLGLALDSSKKVGDQSFLEFFKSRIPDVGLRARLSTIAKKHSVAVLMLDLGAEQIAGNNMADVATVLHSKVMQWAGYSKEAKVAELECMLECDGKLEEFKKLAEALVKKPWGEINNQPLVAKQVASRLAPKFYPDIFPDEKSLNSVNLEVRTHENERVRQLIDLIRKRSKCDKILFVLDEVGNYIAPREALILNLDGFARNLKEIGQGKVWIMATAQQTLAENDQKAQFNSPYLFRLQDRFPIKVHLEANDIREICHRRLLTKEPQAQDRILKEFDAHGQRLIAATRISTEQNLSVLDKKSFAEFYPFLPHHFDLLMQLLGRLAKANGGLGLRSVIKVIQDVLVDGTQLPPGAKVMAEEDFGRLCTAVTYYDNLRHDIARSFPYVTEAVNQTAKHFNADSLELKIAKTIAILQPVADAFPATEANICALLVEDLKGEVTTSAISAALKKMVASASIPVQEGTKGYRFMTAALDQIEKKRRNLHPSPLERQRLFTEALKSVFKEAPKAQLNGSRSVAAAVALETGGRATEFLGEGETIRLILHLCDDSAYELEKSRLITDSRGRSEENNFRLVLRQPAELDTLLTEIKRAEDIAQDRSFEITADINEYQKDQSTRALRLREDELLPCLRKALAAGVFICRGKEDAVATDIVDACRAFMKDFAPKVFHRHADAPVAEVGGANGVERFLQQENLDRLAVELNPLQLVQNGKVNASHPALQALLDYLKTRGKTEGRSIFDDFTKPPYGWTKDCIRYLIAAAITASEIEIFFNGECLKMRNSPKVREALKGNTVFAKVSVLHRNSRPDPEILMRAATRLAQIVGADVMPLEDDVAKIAIKRLPELHKLLDSLRDLLRDLKLESHQRSISELKEYLETIANGDGSDAISLLGQEPSSFFEAWSWSKNTHEALERKGLKSQIKNLRDQQSLLASLQEHRSLADFRLQAGELFAQIDELLQRPDFPSFDRKLEAYATELAKSAKAAALSLRTELQETLAEEGKAILELQEFAEIGPENQGLFAREVEALPEQLPTAAGIPSLQQLLSQDYSLHNRLRDIRRKISSLAKDLRKIVVPPVVVIDSALRPADIPEEKLSLPATLSTLAELDDLIHQLNQLRSRLAAGQRFRLKL